MRVGLALALLAASGFWYTFEGHEIVGSWFGSLTDRGGTPPNGLPTLELQIGFREKRRLARQHRAALEAGGTGKADDKPVAARIRFQEQQLEVSVRLAEGPIARTENERWSLHVDVSDGSSVLDMPAFTLRPADAGQFLNDWWYAQAQREAGLLSTRSTLVNLTINGKVRGLYVLRDAFTRQWLASQGREGGPIVRLDARSAQEKEGQAGTSSFPDPIASVIESPAFVQEGKGRAIPVVEAEAGAGETQAALALLRAFQERRIPASQAFEAELLGRALANANLWGARQGLLWGQARYYYAPSTARLEPIGHEARALAPEYASWIDLAQYDDPSVMEAYAREVARISQPGYLDALRTAHADSAARYEAALPAGDASARELWDLVTERQALLTAALHPSRTVRAYEARRMPDSSLEIEVANLLPYPVVLEQIQVGDRALDLEPAWVADSYDLVHAEAADAVVLRGVKGVVPGALLLRIPASALAPLRTVYSSPDIWRARIVTRLVGLDELVVVDVLPKGEPAISMDRALVVPSVQEALDRHPFLEPGQVPGFLALKAGTWAVAGDLVLPEGMGLVATQPVTLAFEPEALLFASGPLHLHGTEKDGIHLVPQAEPWAGLIVYRAGPEATSTLRHVEIRGVRGVRLRQGGTTGGATFYESPVILEDCRLAGSTAQDALSVVRARVEVVHAAFESASGDALDGEQMGGRVEGCRFYDILGNGIDVRSSQIEVENSRFVRVHDRAIAAGEGSLVDVRDVQVVDAGLALAARDTSYIRARDLRLERIWQAGLAAYGRQWARSQASLHVTGLTVEEDPPILALVQPGSRVVVDGTEAKSGPFDVSALHWREQTLSGVRVSSYRFGDELRLLGYALDASGAAAGDPVRLALYWQALIEIDREYTVFVHALDASGRLVAQWDAMPRENAYPTTHWLAGRVVDDPHSLVLPPDLAAGGYRLAVGLYLWQTGERLPITRPDGTQAPDGMLFLEPSIEIG